MSIKATPVALVMPCLNEAETLRSTCQSLGFGLGENADLREQCLVIVDNGSSDESPSIAREVARTSPSGRVLILSEATRGHVPARSAGIAAAKHHFGADFIIQVDGDTEYCRDYASSLWAYGRTHRPGTLIEAQMEWPYAFAQEHATLTSLIATMDEQFVNDFSSDDVVIDDKGCAYWFCDYESWGGHRREFWSSGEEMLAETTRLFIRGRMNGARRVLAEGITARHSTRNWNRNSELELASAGFPMPPSWQKQWRNSGQQALSEANYHSQEYKAALAMRGKVLTALFRELPRLMAAGSSVTTKAYSEQAVGSHIDRYHGQARSACLIEAAMRIAGVFS